MARKKDPEQEEKSRRAVADRAAKFCIKFIDNWDTYSRKRLTQIKDYELSYYGSVRASLLGRSNIPFPVLAKYVDELKGRLDSFPTIKIDNHRLAQLRVNKKVQASIDILKKPTRGDWARKDRMGRNNTIFAGYGAVDFYTERGEDGTFYANADPIDHNDFVFEPMEGSDLEKHVGVGRFPLFRTKDQLKKFSKAGIYDPEQVKLVLSRTNQSDFKKNDNYFAGRYDRYKALGLDTTVGSYVGQDVFSFAQLQISFEGKRWLITLDYRTGDWVRFQPLKEVYGTDKYSIKLWQTHEDPNVVMCKSPVDDIYPLAETMRIKVNQLIDNATKRIWGQRAVDPNFFPDLNDLEWRRPDQIIVGKSYMNKPISQGVYEFKTDDATNSTLDFIKFMDTFLAGVVGIDPSAVSEEEQKVGVMFGQLQKVGARLGVYNKSYAEMWERGVQQILYGMKQDMTTPMAVQLIGTKGAEWEDLAREELGDPDDFEIVAEASNVENELNEARKKRQTDVLTSISNNPELAHEVNPRWLVEKFLKTAEFSEDEINRGMDVKNYGQEDMLSRADEAVEQILKHKKPRLYHGADIAFFEYIYDYAMDLDDDDPTMRKAIMDYGMAHMQIVIKNMAERAAVEMAAKGTPPDKTDDQGNALPQPAAPAPIPKGPRRPTPPGAPPAPALPVGAGNNTPPSVVPPNPMQ